MKVRVMSISGYVDACMALKMSKRSLTQEYEDSLREAVDCLIMSNGAFITDIPTEYKDMFNLLVTELDKVAKWGSGYGVDSYIDAGHETLLKFIDLSVHVCGLHRGAMDDFRTHAYRMENRFVSSSTRHINAVDMDEMSDWYKDKILYSIPEKQLEGYVATPFGYVREGYENDPDVLRGLYPLAIPTEFIFKVNLQQMRHIYMRRNTLTHASPELGIMVEDIADQVENMMGPTVLGKLIRYDYCSFGISWISRRPTLLGLRTLETRRITIKL